MWCRLRLDSNHRLQHAIIAGYIALVIAGTLINCTNAQQRVRHFFIQSMMNSLALDIGSASKEPGTHVIMWEMRFEGNDNANQLWYEDTANQTIRSAMHDMCLTINNDNELVVDAYTSATSQQWVYENNKIRNQNDRQVIDIVGADRDSGARLCKWTEHGGLNQMFELVYK